MNTKSVFIAIAPNHINNFESIIGNKLCKGDAILINPGGFSTNQSLWDVEIKGNINLIYRKATRIGRMLYQLKKTYNYSVFFSKKIDSIIFDSKTDFYFCNLDDVLTNHLFQLGRKIGFQSNYVVEDGILNYYYPELNNQRKKTLNQKMLISKILSLSFKPAFIHPTNIDSSVVNAQFVRVPQKSICPQKSVFLPFKPIRYNPRRKTVLILGQDIMAQTHNGVDYYINRLETLLEYILKNHSKDSIIYKPHRNGNSKIAKQLVFERFKKPQIFNESNPIEEVIHKIKPGFIYSFESSAIINIKLALHDTAVHFGVLPYIRKKNLIENLYRELEIEILK